MKDIAKKRGSAGRKSAARGIKSARVAGNKTANKSKATILIPENTSQEQFAWHILGEESFLPARPVSDFDLLEASLTGIKKQSIISLAKVMNIPLKDMAALLNLSYKTLGRKKESDTFDSLVSSLSIEIALTVAHGLTVFEDEIKFNRWLNKENRALKGQKPIELLNTPTGIKLVNQVLGRIDEGIYS